MSKNCINILAKTKLKYFIQPTFVRWSNLYLGIPPLMNMSSAINERNFRATISALRDGELTDQKSEE